MTFELHGGTPTRFTHLQVWLDSTVAVSDSNGCFLPAAVAELDDCFRCRAVIQCITAKPSTATVTSSRPLNARAGNVKDGKGDSKGV